MKTPKRLEDCVTTHQIIDRCEQDGAGLVLRNGGRTVAIATATDAVSLHESDRTLTKAERSAILDALRTIGAIAKVLAVPGAAFLLLRLLGLA